MLLGEELPRGRWARIGEALIEQQHRKDLDELDLCRRNLAFLAEGVELWQADSEGGRQLPDSLGGLKALPGYQVLPTCPSARRDTYSAGYHLDRARRTYRLACSGAHHRVAGVRSGHPQVDSRWGLTPLEESELAWWPDSYKVDVLESTAKKGYATLKLRESWAFAGAPAKVEEASLALRWTTQGSKPHWQLDPSSLSTSGWLTRVLDLKAHTEQQEQAPPTATAQQCAQVLRRTSTALEAWACDHQGRYPGSLQDLVPRYLHTLPVCPQAALVIRPAYTPGPAGTSYVLRCRGQHPRLQVTEAGLDEASRAQGGSPPRS